MYDQTTLPFDAEMHRLSLLSSTSVDRSASTFYEHNAGEIHRTDTILADSLRLQYPHLNLTLVSPASADFLLFAKAGNATVTPVVDSADRLTIPLTQRGFRPPTTRLDGAQGSFTESVIFGKYKYVWKEQEFLLYYVTGSLAYSPFQNQFQFLLGPDERTNDSLNHAAAEYLSQLHGEIWVFDGGFWQKNAELYQSVLKASWDDVILDEDMKAALQDDVTRFFDSRERYGKLRVPWKRGVIYYGPPGNGKTVSIKATMNTLYRRKEPVPSLYVRSLSSFAGPEYSIKQIFAKARQTAPCLLIFEDLDSLVSDQVRSYFLNEVDGLQSNDGIFMVGSTNHLERLDPGISKRPSRFDRKFYFPKPDEAERTKYCEYWRHKLADNKEIEFPPELSKKIAEITEDFSFAYIQEAFVASLLAIAARDEGKAVVFAPWVERKKADVDKLVLWVEMQKQVKILREEM